MEDMKLVGYGGFGRVYKARHKDWHFDVAVKILKEDSSHIMFQEASFMDLASCEFVLRVYGIYESPSQERGLVTEYMKRGSIESLQNQLSGPPPWPLAFRLAHQTALAMNFLHLRDIVHLDLKPNNILLNDELSARLADFGLATVSKSVVGGIRDSHTGPQGTFKYMPPEAFQLSYKPVRAFDIYSFGVLLWSIFSGKEPYPGKDYALVELRISAGDRPQCEELRRLRVVGIKDIVELINICWKENPNERPHFTDIVTKTERLFSGHSSDIRRAVDEVLTKLDSPYQAQPYLLKPLNECRGTHVNDIVDHGPVMEVKQEKDDSTGIFPNRTKQNNTHICVECTKASSNVHTPALSYGGASKTITRKEKAQFVDHHRQVLVQRISHSLAIAEELGKMVHSETYNIIRTTSINEDRVRELYSGPLRSGGERVKAAFYDALKKHESLLMEDLEK